MNIGMFILALFRRNPQVKRELEEVSMTLEQRPIKESSSNIELDRQLVVVDIGCRWGSAERFIKGSGSFQVYVFNPDIEECERLSTRYEGGAVSIVPLGLAGSAGKRILYVTHEPACSSLLMPDPELTERYPALHCARHVTSVEVETVTLDDWAAENNVQDIDYIKVDTQGTELEILKGSINVLKTTRALEVKVEFNPIYLGQPIFSDVDLFLRSEGFVLWKLTNQVHYSKCGSADEAIGEDIICYDDKHRIQHPIYGGQLYWDNALYVKKNVLAAEENSEAQKSRDIALFQALGMPDVVCEITNTPPLRIAIISTPRSGNTWLRYLLAGIYRAEQLAVHAQEDVDWGELPKGNFILQLHWRCTPEITETLQKQGFKIVVLHRHPLDILISILQFSPKEPQTNSWLKSESGNEDSIRGCKPTNERFLKYSVGVRAKALLGVSVEWSKAPGVNMVSYEDMVRDTHETLLSLTSKLGKPLVDIDEVVARNTIDRLRDTTTNSHFWQGSPGLWRKLMPNEVAQEIAKEQRFYFDAFHYECNPDPSLTDETAELKWSELLTMKSKK
jgi:FkbM family methyltransferase